MSTRAWSGGHSRNAVNRSASGGYTGCAAYSAATNAESSATIVGSRYGAMAVRHRSGSNSIRSSDMGPTLATPTVVTTSGKLCAQPPARATGTGKLCRSRVGRAPGRRPAALPALCGRFQRVRQVGQQVGGVLDAAGQPDQPGRGVAPALGPPVGAGVQSPERG